MVLIKASKLVRTPLYDHVVAKSLVSRMTLLLLTLNSNNNKEMQ